MRISLSSRVLYGFVLALLPILAGALLAPSVSLAAGDANEAFCPNEAMPGFQPYLPDCRAYEMVSPPFKEGTRASVAATSSDGSRGLFSLSTGVFAGAEGVSGLYTSYGFMRTESGWATSAINPPASQFPANVLVGASADLGRTLWAARDSSQSIHAKDIYVREADGTFVKVGPMVPPSAEAGPPAGGDVELPLGYGYIRASSDLSHVLFEIRAAGNALWPGDTTREENIGSLYEYVGRENRQPKLVGVSDGSTVVNGKTLPAGQLISNCGTALGLQEKDAYNAMSANGETVFFTANECERAPPVNELYARLGQIETVAISEPPPSQCLKCNTAVKAPAEFQGASEDGSKVFFLTEQQLFTGDTTKNLYEYDFANLNGHKIVRVSGGSATPEVQGVARVSEDGTHVYFVAKAVLTSEPDRSLQPGHQVAVAEENNLYVFERDATYPGGHVAFVATLSSETKAELGKNEEPCAGLIGSPKEECEEPFVREYEKRNRLDEADWNVRDSRPVQSTRDGRFTVFESVADLTPGDASTQPQVFEYDALKEELVRVSSGQVGYANGIANANAHGSWIPTQGYEEPEPTTAETNLAVSADGSHIVFNSTGALAPGAEAAAAAGASSAYEYRSVGSISNGNVYLVSDGTNTLNAEALGMDASAENIFFTTADPLLAQDLDTQYDVYDARAEGGFPASVSPAACEGEACRGASSGQPSFGVPGSVSVPGGGNLSPPPSGPVAKPKVKPLTRAQKLAKALNACRHKPHKKRPACEKQAGRAYGPARKAKKSHNGGK